MSFAWPHLLWLLVLPVALLVLELKHHRSIRRLHPRILRGEAGHGSVRVITEAGQPAAKSRGRLWLVLGLGLALVSLARPQWGHLDEPVFDQSREILIAIDVSRSMLSDDVKPSRLERSRLLIRSLLDKLKGERVGLVAFSGTAFLQSPLSADYEILREFLPSLGPDFLPEGGTNFKALLDTSLAAFASSGSADRFLIVLSDGEATDAGWKPPLEEVKQRGIRILALGIGTESGTMIPDGSGSFMKDERGAVVLSKLDSSTLRELASETGGAYRDASVWLDLAEVLRETVETGRKGEFVETNTVRLVERYQWALGPALLCLLLSLWREIPVHPKPRTLQAARNAPSPPLHAVAPLLALLLVAAFSNLPAAEPKPEAALAKIVSRLSTQDTPTGRDWAELGRETVVWGQKLQSEQKPVAEGPVRDALAAVGLGAALDPKTTDWPALRAELEALLKKPEEKKDEKKDQPQDQPQSQQDKDQQKQDQQNKDEQQQQQDQSQPQDEQQQTEPKQDPQKQDADSAFGDMKQDPPPPQGDTQTIGGEPDKKETNPESADPNLALPIQKLDQLRNQDSPAKLFQMMQGEKKQDTPNKGKNW